MNRPEFENYWKGEPDAFAKVKGSPQYPDISGRVLFYQTKFGVLVVTSIEKLPNPSDSCDSPIFAFHIHEGGSCTGNTEDPFANTKSHYNPYQCPHPYHAGDLPPLFGAGGYAYSVVLTDRFIVDEIIGKTVVIHSSYDDFTTQPSGNAGAKIACGMIVANRAMRYV